jgi:hypothetical protein
MVIEMSAWLIVAKSNSWQIEPIVNADNRTSIASRSQNSRQFGGDKAFAARIDP